MKYIYDYDLEFLDILAILFRRNKKCPSCSGIVDRKTKKIDLGKGWDKSRKGLKFRVDYAQKYKVELRYICRECEKSFKPAIFW